MDIFEEARTISGMLKMCDSSQSELAKRLGVSQSYIANKIRLLKFPPDVQRKIKKAGLSERHARALLKILDSDKLSEALDIAINEELTVAATEALVDFYHDGRAPERIRSAEKTRRIELFKDTIHSSVKTLKSLGIEVNETMGYYGKKTYITIALEG